MADQPGRPTGGPEDEVLVELRREAEELKQRIRELTPQVRQLAPRVQELTERIARIEEERARVRSAQEAAALPHDTSEPAPGTDDESIPEEPRRPGVRLSDLPSPIVMKPSRTRRIIGAVLVVVLVAAAFAAGYFWTDLDERIRDVTGAEQATVTDESSDAEAASGQWTAAGTRSDAGTDGDIAATGDHSTRRLGDRTVKAPPPA
jgi:hypothetical protein